MEEKAFDNIFRELLNNRETTPPDNIWKNIEEQLVEQRIDKTLSTRQEAHTPILNINQNDKTQESPNNGAIDDIFKTKLEALETNPSNQVWDDISKQLPLNLTVRRILNHLSRIAAIIVIGLFFTSIVGQSNLWFSVSNWLFPVKKHIVPAPHQDLWTNKRPIQLDYFLSKSFYQTIGRLDNQKAPIHPFVLVYEDVSNTDTHSLMVRSESILNTIPSPWQINTLVIPKQIALTHNDVFENDKETKLISNKSATKNAVFKEELKEELIEKGNTDNKTSDNIIVTEVVPEKLQTKETTLTNVKNKTTNTLEPTLVVVEHTNTNQKKVINNKTELIAPVKEEKEINDITYNEPSTKLRPLTVSRYKQTTKTIDTELFIKRYPVLEFDPKARAESQLKKQKALKKGLRNTNLPLIDKSDKNKVLNRTVPQLDYLPLKPSHLYLK